MSPAEPKFFSCGIRDDFSATFQRLIFTKFGHDTWIHVPSKIFVRNFRKVSVYWPFAPKNLKIEGVKHVPYSDEPTANGTHCTEMLHFVIQGLGSFRAGSTFLYDLRFRSYSLPIFSYKMPKKYLFVRGLYSR